MNVNYFLLERLTFVQEFYETASAPFIERKRKIEEGVDPYIPPYSEDDEPPFLSEWIDADDSLQVLGYSCVSMLAASLHLLLETWARELRIHDRASDRARFKKGWIRGYGAIFSDQVGINFDESPANLEVLEEIVLARNSAQHPASITTQRIGSLFEDRARLKRSVFLDDRSKRLLEEMDPAESIWLTISSFHISRDSFLSAMSEVRSFATWLDAEVTEKLYRR